MLPMCPFVRKWTKRHPDYHGLVHRRPASRDRQHRVAYLAAIRLIAGEVAALHGGSQPDEQPDDHHDCGEPHVPPPG